MDVFLGMIIGAGLASLAIVAYVKFGRRAPERDLSKPRAFGMPYGTGRLQTEDFGWDLNALAASVHAANKKWWEEWVCEYCEGPLETVRPDTGRPGFEPTGKCNSNTCHSYGCEQYGKKKPIQRNKGELIALMHSELSEMLEGARKGLPDDHLPQRSMEECEAADTLIRMLDYVGGFKLDLDGATRDKLRYNRTRADHSHAARNAAGGKKF